MYFTVDDEANASRAQVNKEMREYLGIYQNPLDEHVVRVRRLPKIESTQFRTLDGQIANSHQHSAARFERDLTTSQAGNMNEGVQMHHGAAGMTG